MSTQYPSDKLNLIERFEYIENKRADIISKHYSRLSVAIENLLLLLENAENMHDEAQIEMNNKRSDLEKTIEKVKQWQKTVSNRFMY